MANGWQLLDPILKIDPATDADPAVVSDYCDRLSAHNADLRKTLIGALRAAKRGRVADHIEGGFADVDLFNEYFGNRCESFSVGAGVASHRVLEGQRAAVQAWLAFDLVCWLTEQLKAVPTAKVNGSDDSANPPVYERAYRHAALRPMVISAQSVQQDFDGYFQLAMEFLTGTRTGLFFRSSVWPFDFDILAPAILLGFLPTGAPTALNAGIVTSPIVAAGAVRSQLEAVLWCNDFSAVMEDAPRIDGDTWDAAVRQHVRSKALSDAEAMWVRTLYGLLSVALHEGRSLTRGEIWMFIRVTRTIAAKIAHARRPT